MTNRVTDYLSKTINKPLTVIETIQGIAAKAGSDLKQEVIEATTDKNGVNLRSLAHANLQPLMETNWAKEKFLNALVQVIGSQIVSAPNFKDPFEVFKRQGFDYGAYIEEIFTYLKGGRDFDPNADDSPFQKFEVEAQTAIHRNIIRREYPVSITKEEYMTAFLSENNFNNFVNKMFRVVETADQIEEFKNVKTLLEETLSEYQIEGQTRNLRGIEMDTTQDGYIETAAKQVQNIIKNFTFPDEDNQNNIAGVPNPTSIDDVYFIVNTDFSTEIDFMLANAFNMDKATISAKTIVVDKFKEFDGAGKYNGKTPAAFIISKNSVIFDDIVREMDWIWNPHARRYNIFLHHQYMLSFSPFENAAVVYM